jgi:hypothetical protein
MFYCLCSEGQREPSTNEGSPYRPSSYLPSFIATNTTFEVTEIPFSFTFAFSGLDCSLSFTGFKLDSHYKKDLQFRIMCQYGFNSYEVLETKMSITAENKRRIFLLY